MSEHTSKRRKGIVVLSSPRGMGRDAIAQPLVLFAITVTTIGHARVVLVESSTSKESEDKNGQDGQGSGTTNSCSDDGARRERTVTLISSKGV